MSKNASNIKIKEMQKYLFRKKMQNTSFNSWSLSLEDRTIDNIFYIFLNITIMETMSL